MTRDQTHYVGDDCPGGHHSAYLTDDESAGLLAAQFGPPPPGEYQPRITGEDRAAAVEAAASDSGDPGPDYVVGDLYAALESAYRPGGIVDRAVAAELDQLAQDAANTGINPDPGFLLWLANERREGRRDDD